LSWWMTKRTRPPANPNRIGKDPDIAPDTVVFLSEDAAAAKGLQALINRYQGWLFFPLLTLEGLNLHVTAFRSLLTGGRARGDVRMRVGELVTITLRLSLYAAAVFWVLPLGMAFAFLGVQLAVFGVYMGASFAPNHKGMAIIPENSKIDFLSKQVLTSRNIRGGWWMNILMGGLNFQIEHHLFPSMPRPHLARAREIVREHCANLGLPYTVTSLVQSYGIVVLYLNRVGLSARDPFDCPMFRQLRGASSVARRRTWRGQGRPAPAASRGRRAAVPPVADEVDVRLRHAPVADQVPAHAGRERRLPHRVRVDRPRR